MDKTPIPENLLSSPNPKDITHQTLVQDLMNISADLADFEEKRNLSAADRATRALGELQQNVHFFKKHITVLKQTIRKNVKDSNYGKKTA